MSLLSGIKAEHGRESSEGQRGDEEPGVRGRALSCHLVRAGAVSSLAASPRETQSQGREERNTRGRPTIVRGPAVPSSLCLAARRPPWRPRYILVRRGQPPCHTWTREQSTFAARKRTRQTRMTPFASRKRPCASHCRSTPIAWARRTSVTGTIDDFEPSPPSPIRRTFHVGRKPALKARLGRHGPDWVEKDALSQRSRSSAHRRCPCDSYRDFSGRSMSIAGLDHAGGHSIQALTGSYTTVDSTAQDWSVMRVDASRGLTLASLAPAGGATSPRRVSMKLGVLHRRGPRRRRARHRRSRSPSKAG